MNEREIAKQKALAAVQEESARKLRELDAKHDAIDALPEGVPMPYFVHGWGKSGLYGSSASMDWRGSKYDSLKETGHIDRPLKDALALLDAIAHGGKILPLFYVKDGCAAIKPDCAVSDKDRERATIEGPFYGARITREPYKGAELAAHVILTNGLHVYVGIGLTQAHLFGSWRRDYVRGSRDDENSYKLVKQPAPLGQQKTVQYGGGSFTGSGSAGSIVYLFDNRDALDALAETFSKKL